MNTTTNGTTSTPDKCVHAGGIRDALTTIAKLVGEYSERLPRTEDEAELRSKIAERIGDALMFVADIERRSPRLVEVTPGHDCTVRVVPPAAPQEATLTVPLDVLASLLDATIPTPDTAVEWMLAALQALSDEALLISAVAGEGYDVQHDAARVASRAAGAEKVARVLLAAEKKAAEVSA